MISCINHNGPNSWGSANDINVLTPRNVFGGAVACPNVPKWVFLLEGLKHRRV